jgi:hypothetical protein
MYDVYLNKRKELLVVAQGFSVPSELGGNWRKKKRAARSVSEEIKAAIQTDGYYRRKLANAPKVGERR